MLCGLDQNASSGEALDLFKSRKNSTSRTFTYLHKVHDFIIKLGFYLFNEVCPYFAHNVLCNLHKEQRIHVRCLTRRFMNKLLCVLLYC